MLSKDRVYQMVESVLKQAQERGIEYLELHTLARFAIELIFIAPEPLRRRLHRAYYVLRSLDCARCEDRLFYDHRIKVPPGGKCFLLCHTCNLVVSACVECDGAGKCLRRKLQGLLDASIREE